MASEKPHKIGEQINSETVALSAGHRKLVRRKPNTKRNGEPKKKPGPKPKKVVAEPKMKEKKVRDKKPLKEKRKQVCPICGMLVSFLPYHLEVHDPNIFYDCDICGHRAPSRTVIINHFRNKHFSKRYVVAVHRFYFDEILTFQFHFPANIHVLIVH